MMREIYKSPFQSISYNSEKATIEFRWCEETCKLEEKSFKKEILAQAKFAQQYKPVKCIINTQEFKYAIPPAIQKWIDDDMTGQLLTDTLEKLAIVVNEDFVTQISITQIIDERISRNLDGQIFVDFDKANTWLLQ